MFKLLSISVLTLVLPLAAQPRGSVNNGKTGTNPNCKGRDVCIDAATGASFGESIFRRYDNVTILLYNKNPFCCTYRLSQSTKVIGESTAPDFLRTFFPVVAKEDDKKEATASLNTLRTEMLEVKELQRDDPGKAQKLLNLYKDTTERLEAASRDAFTNMEKADDAMRTYTDQLALLRRPDLGQTAATCSARIVQRMAAHNLLPQCSLTFSQLRRLWTSK